MDLTVSTKLYRDSLRRIRRNQIFMVPISMAVFVLLWELAVRLSGWPAFMLPSPARVWNRFIIAINDGSLLRHSLVTLSEVLAGFGLGALFASLLGYLIARSPAVERFLSPYIIASQAIPIVAIAPILVIWLPGWPIQGVDLCSDRFLPDLDQHCRGTAFCPRRSERSDAFAQSQSSANF
jgi:ABC-type anion transport system duplicated permease subunit